jgi:hypothetical protein
MEGLKRYSGLRIVPVVLHAAFGLGVSDTMLYRCQPVIVEGPWDQIYLSAINTYLIGKGRIKPGRELVFVPSGGVKGIAPITSIINRYLPRPANAEKKVDELAQGGSPIVPQVEAYAKRHGIELELGWKVEDDR